MTKYDYLLKFQRRLLDQVAASLSEIARGGISAGILLIGGSGTGKSMILRRLEELHKSSMLGSQRIIPCCRVQARAQADATTIAADVLARLGKPIPPARQKLKFLEPDMHRAFIACETRLFIVEEAHNATLSASDKMRGQTSRLLKNLWNIGTTDDAPRPHHGPALSNTAHPMVLVLSATDELLKALKNDEELRSRFPCVIFADRTSFSPPESFKEFRHVLRSQIHGGDLELLLDPNDNLLASRCMLACQGHLRDLWSLLQRAKTLSVAPPILADTNALLALAFDSAFGDSDRRENPFRQADTEVQSSVEKAMRMHRLGLGGAK
jgi:hypothetical protein